MDPNAAAAHLQKLGKRPIRVHDPSTIARCKDDYWIFCTGRGTPSFHSKDLITWQRGPTTFTASPSWVASAVPRNRSGLDFWAPDVTFFRGKYLLYFSVSTFGKNTSAIGLATNVTLDPCDPGYAWKDGGLVIQSDPNDDFNTIDPAVTADAEGNLWLAFGSFWGGIKLIQLDPATGKRIAPDSPVYPLAHYDSIEASYIYYHSGLYYLFVNWGMCCRGVNSTYNIRVGRSIKITGPYLDKEDKDMLKGGGTLLLATDGPFIGPGHAGILRESDKYWLGMHFYDGTQHGMSYYALRPLTWSDDGWPVVGVNEQGAAAASSRPAGKLAAKPLFRDPVFDGAADPVLCWNRAEKKWFMFYTNRRANEPNAPGVTWVHGTKIGIAESSDGGATWTYRGTADIPHGGPGMTHWAPEVIYHDGTYHMFLTFVPGIFRDWNHPRDIIHLTSKDMLSWKYDSTLKLSSDRVIDACVLQLPDKTWRLWYNNEVDHKSIYYADSNDLATWQDKGKVTGVGERPGEGPKAFRWHGQYWMVVDIWDGLGVYRSADALQWERQAEDLLKVPGKGPDDQVKGGHPDVVVSGDRAYLFYFTHPGRRGENARGDATEQRRSSIQVVELQYKDGWLTCDRDQPTYIHLLPPQDER
jgi:beta-xylosidase